MIQYFHLKGLSPTTIKAELDSTLEESAPSFTTIKYWVADFKRGRTSCHDEHRSGRPNEVTTTEMMNKIHKMVLDDRWLKVSELTDMLRISKNAVHRTLIENLVMRKLCVRWTPRLLTMEQKKRREDVSIECLEKKSTASIMRTYYSVWVMKLRKNGRIWRNRKCRCIKTVHQLTHSLSWWLKSMS